MSLRDALQGLGAPEYNSFDYPLGYAWALLDDNRKKLQGVYQAALQEAHEEATRQAGGKRVESKNVARIFTELVAKREGGDSLEMRKMLADRYLEIHGISRARDLL